MRSSRSRMRVLNYAASGLALIGVVGYVGGRFIAAADERFIEVVFFSTYVMLAGLTLGGLGLVVVSFATRRPAIPRALAAVAILWGILLVLFPYSRAIAYPGAALAAVAIVLLVVGWKDLNDPKLWGGSPPDSSKASN